MVEWTLNNGILDITLRLEPLDETPTSDPIDEAFDDDEPVMDDGSIAIDLADDDDDDDEDDGGIPIL